MPEIAAIYFAIDKEGALLYIGKSKNLRRRLTRHEHASLFEHLGSVRLAYLQIDGQALDKLEADLIKRFKPKLNVNHIPATPSPKPKIAFSGYETVVRKNGEGMLTIREASEVTGASIASLRVWLADDAERTKRFPNARKETSPLGDYWVIPESDLAGYQNPGRGRPRKPITELKGKPRRKDK